MNLDPAAEHFNYNVSIDIRNLISLEDVTEELQYGPNGGLVYCMEYLLENLAWLDEQLGTKSFNTNTKTFFKSLNSIN